jgi:PPM family protein phosphatase
MSEIHSFIFSDKGSRDENQDAVKTTSLNSAFISCIADGVGGSNCGRFAATQSIAYFLEMLASTEISNMGEALRATHDKIIRLQQEKPECNGMATTFTACMIMNFTLRGVHTGDSRLCILRGNGLKQLTDSHTEAERLLKAGKLSKEQLIFYPRRNVLDSAIGAKSNLIVQNFDFSLKNGDRNL